MAKILISHIQSASKYFTHRIFTDSVLIDDKDKMYCTLWVYIIHYTYNNKFSLFTFTYTHVWMLTRIHAWIDNDFISHTIQSTQNMFQNHLALFTFMRIHIVFILLIQNYFLKILPHSKQSERVNSSI